MMRFLGIIPPNMNEENQNLAGNLNQIQPVRWNDRGFLKTCMVGVRSGLIAIAFIFQR